jgi:hypothetical protein
MDFNTTIDIILKDLREVREIIDDLKNYPGMPMLQVELAKSKCRSAEEVIALLKILKPVEKEPVIPVTRSAAKEPIIEKEPQTIEKPEKRIVQKTPAADKKSSSTIIADRFAGPAGTISKPVGNLADAIGISDRFLFIKEIFKGNQSEYEQAVEKLNKAENLPDAMAVIMSYTGENEESEVVSQLLDIVKRKLPSDG